MRETAESFFHACESGKGWEVCREYCTPEATFSAQSDVLGAVRMLEHYVGWMQSLFVTMPDAGYEIKAFAVDEERGKAMGFGMFHGTHTGEGGPVAPTGKRVEAEYVYIMEFEGGKIRHMTKVWNDGFSMQQLGWG
ncbi:MAG: ester cyclase [Fimbriimonadales bacterium]